VAKAKHASTVGVHLPNNIIAEIDRRVGLLPGYTRSKYVAALITRWYARGAAPVLALEKDALDPIVRPDGMPTWIGAGLKPGARVSEFADDEPPVVAMVAEAAAAPKRPKSA
jgi:hypothetical protein